MIQPPGKPGKPVDFSCETTEKDTCAFRPPPPPPPGVLLVLQRMLAGGLCAKLGEAEEDGLEVGVVDPGHHRLGAPGIYPIPPEKGERALLGDLVPKRRSQAELQGFFLRFGLTFTPKGFF